MNREHTNDENIDTEVVDNDELSGAENMVGNDEADHELPVVEDESAKDNDDLNKSEDVKNPAKKSNKVMIIVLVIISIAVIALGIYMSFAQQQELNTNLGASENTKKLVEQTYGGLNYKLGDIPGYDVEKYNKEILDAKISEYYLSAPPRQRQAIDQFFDQLRVEVERINDSVADASDAEISLKASLLTVVYNKGIELLVAAKDGIETTVDESDFSQFANSGLVDKYQEIK